MLLYLRVARLFEHEVAGDAVSRHNEMDQRSIG